MGKYTTFPPEEAARHREAIRRAHLEQLLPHFLGCDAEGRRKFNQIVSRDDVAELHRMAEECNQDQGAN